MTLEALNQALASRTIVAGCLVHHSDRGVQYASGDYIARLEARGIQPSMSRIACPWDNAQAESFMKTLKQEEVDGRTYRMIDEAKSAIGTSIDDVYNTQRLHSALNYQAPVVFETSDPAGCCAAASRIAHHRLCLIPCLRHGVQSSSL